MLVKLEKRLVIGCAAPIIVKSPTVTDVSKITGLLGCIAPEPTDCAPAFHVAPHCSVDTTIDSQGCDEFIAMTMASFRKSIRSPELHSDSAQHLSASFRVRLPQHGYLSQDFSDSSLTSLNQIGRDLIDYFGMKVGRRSCPQESSYTWVL